MADRADSTATRRSRAPSTASASTTTEGTVTAGCVSTLTTSASTGAGTSSSQRALAGTPARRATCEVGGRDPQLGVHLGAWCRAQGHECRIRAADDETVALVRPGPDDGARWAGATRAGGRDADAG